MKKYFTPYFSQTAASTLQLLSEPRNEMLAMIFLMLTSTTADFIQNKQQHAEYLRTVAHNPKTAYHQKWPLNASIFSFPNEKWWICSYPALFKSKILEQMSPNMQPGVQTQPNPLFNDKGKFHSSGEWFSFLL